MSKAAKPTRAEEQRQQRERLRRTLIARSAEAEERIAAKAVHHLLSRATKRQRSSVWRIDHRLLTACAIRSICDQVEDKQVAESIADDLTAAKVTRRAFTEWLKRVRGAYDLIQREEIDAIIAKAQIEGYHGDAAAQSDLLHATYAAKLLARLQTANLEHLDPDDHKALIQGLKYVAQGAHTHERIKLDRARLNEFMRKIDSSLDESNTERKLDALREGMSILAQALGHRTLPASGAKGGES